MTMLSGLAISTTYDTDVCELRGADIFFGRETWHATVTLPRPAAPTCSSTTVTRRAAERRHRRTANLTLTASRHRSHGYHLPAALASVVLVIRGGTYELRACTLPTECLAMRPARQLLRTRPSQTFWVTIPLPA